MYNNIHFFLKGPLSQWHGGFSNHKIPPIKIDIWSFTKFFKHRYYKNLISSYYHYDSYDYPGYLEFSCAEQAMMFAKAIIFGDFETADAIMEESHPGKMQLLGRQVKDFDLSYWNEIKFEVLYLINLEKFTQNKELQRYLLDTKHQILAENSSDMIYGIGTIDEGNSMLWTGENLLGRVLMSIRETLKKKVETE